MGNNNNIFITFHLFMKVKNLHKEKLYMYT